MKVILILIVGFILSGCAGLNSDFSCNETATGSCITVEQANEKAKNKLFTPKNVNIIKYENLDINKISNNKDIPLRTKEQLSKVWIAPYVDSNDNYNEERIIFFKVVDSDWIGAN